jgi:hypothetical protein
MIETPIVRNEIKALTSFTVGTLDERDAMMVIEYAETPDDYVAGIRRKLPVAMTPKQARELAAGLLMAANSASMGQPPSETSN